MQKYNKISKLLFVIVIVLVIALCAVGCGKDVTYVVEVNGVTGYSDAIIDADSKSISFNTQNSVTSFSLSAINLAYSELSITAKDSSGTVISGNTLTLAVGSNEFSLVIEGTIDYDGDEVNVYEDGWTLKITRLASTTTDTEDTIEPEDTTEPEVEIVYGDVNDLVKELVADVCVYFDDGLAVGDVGFDTAYASKMEEIENDSFSYMSIDIILYAVEYAGITNKEVYEFIQLYEDKGGDIMGYVFTLMDDFVAFINGRSTVEEFKTALDISLWTPFETIQETIADALDIISIDKIADFFVVFAFGDLVPKVAGITEAEFADIVAGMDDADTMISTMAKYFDMNSELEYHSLYIGSLFNVFGSIASGCVCELDGADLKVTFETTIDLLMDVMSDEFSFDDLSVADLKTVINTVGEIMILIDESVDTTYLEEFLSGMLYSEALASLISDNLYLLSIVGTVFADFTADDMLWAIDLAKTFIYADEDTDYEQFIGEVVYFASQLFTEAIDKLELDIDELAINLTEVYATVLYTQSNDVFVGLVKGIIEEAYTIASTEANGDYSGFVYLSDMIDELVYSAYDYDYLYVTSYGDCIFDITGVSEAEFFEILNNCFTIYYNTPDYDLFDVTIELNADICSGYDLSKSGEQEITITYEGLSTTIKVFLISEDNVDEFSPSVSSYTSKKQAFINQDEADIENYLYSYVYNNYYNMSGSWLHNGGYYSIYQYYTFVDLYMVDIDGEGVYYVIAEYDCGIFGSYYMPIEVYVYDTENLYIIETEMYIYDSSIAQDSTIYDLKISVVETYNNGNRQSSYIYAPSDTQLETAIGNYTLEVTYNGVVYKLSYSVVDDLYLIFDNSYWNSSRSSWSNYVKEYEFKSDSSSYIDAYSDVEDFKINLGDSYTGSCTVYETEEWWGGVSYYTTLGDVIDIASQYNNFTYEIYNFDSSNVGNWITITFECSFEVDGIMCYYTYTWNNCNIV